MIIHTGPVTPELSRYYREDGLCDLICRECGELLLSDAPPADKQRMEWIMANHPPACRGEKGFYTMYYLGPSLTEEAKQIAKEDTPFQIERRLDQLEDSWSGSEPFVRLRHRIALLHLTGKLRWLAEKGMKAASSIRTPQALSSADKSLWQLLAAFLVPWLVFEYCERIDTGGQEPSGRWIEYTEYRRPSGPLMARVLEHGMLGEQFQLQIQGDSQLRALVRDGYRIREFTDLEWTLVPACNDAT